MHQGLSTALAVLVLLVGTLAASEAAGAFHTGGVGSCGGCHSMHQSEGGEPLPGGPAVGALRASDPGSLCLTCHAGPGGAALPSVYSFDGSALTPGGDFYWLTRTFTWLGGTSAAASHGHNILARDFNLTEDPLRSLSPGGSYPAARLTCISCHDPHGRSRGSVGPISVSGSYGEEPPPGTSPGSYRLLGGAGYTRYGYSFSFAAPVARQNPSQPFAETDPSHVDYGSAMSEWCGNCHAAIVADNHNSGTGFAHPSGEGSNLEPDILSNYNSYIRTGDLSGTAATAYLQFVPFERGVTDKALLDPARTDGPDAGARVMCLSCHRAHASAFPFAGRWDLSATLLSQSHPALGDVGATANDVFNSYYGRDVVGEFGAGQKPFCEKCHVNGTP